MGFKKFVQAGRVVHITVGAHQEKLAVIVDIINGNQVIVDNSVEQVPRMPIPLKRLVLTDIVLDIERGASSEEVAEKVKAGNVRQNWDNTPEGQRRIKYQKKLSMTDFERFKVGLLLKTVSFYAEKCNDKKESQRTQKVRGSLITYNF